MFLYFFPGTKFNVLVSFGLRGQEMKNFVSANPANVSGVILDSGAFTLNMAKSEKTTQKINFESYIRFLQLFKDKFDFIFNYDANFEDDGVCQNDEYLQELRTLGIKVVPVVHSYSDEEFKRYEEQGHKLIALGFSPNKKKNAKNIRKYSNIANANGIDIHALGVTSWGMLEDSPIQYSDSSSWVQYGKYGMMKFWNESKVVSKPSGEIDYSKCCETYYVYADENKPKNPNRLYYNDLDLSHPLPQFVEKYLKCDWYDVLNPKKSFLLNMVNIYFFLKLQEKVTKYHASKGWVFD